MKRDPLSFINGTSDGIANSRPEDKKPVVVKKIDPDSELGKKILAESVELDKKKVPDDPEKKARGPNKLTSSCYFRPKNGLTDAQKRAVLRYWRDDPHEGS